MQAVSADNVRKKVMIRGIPVDSVSPEQAREQIIRFTREDGFHRVVTLNAEMLEQCSKDGDICEFVRSADLIVPDGQGVILASRILGTPLKEKVAGCELGESLVSVAGKESLRVFFLGGKEGVPERAAEKLKEKYPDFCAAGTHHGYFDKTGEENQAVLELIQKSGANVLFVCFGFPQQDQWMERNRAKLPGVRVGIGLGGSLDSYAGVVKRAPSFWIRCNLEWLYRVFQRPSRLLRVAKIPVLMIRVMGDRLRRAKE